MAVSSVIVIRVTYEDGCFERDLRGLFCCQVKHALSCLNKDYLVLKQGTRGRTVYGHRYTSPCIISHMTKRCIQN